MLQKMSVLPFHFLLFHFALVGVYSSAIVIKSGVVKNQGQAQNENSQDVKFHKGIANFEGDEGFNKDDEKKFVLAQDSGRYGDELSNKKSHLDSNNVNEEIFHQNAGQNQGNLDNKVAHHKGHHKSGFQNSYHKDETGSNSSFFDDGSDEGDESLHRNYQGSFGDAGQHQQNAGKYDSSNIANDQSRHGQYDNAGRVEKDRANRQNYNRNNYYDNREDLNRRNLGNNYEGADRYEEEKFVERPYYHHPQPIPYYHDEPYRRSLPPPPIKEHITIYEDPRYVDSDLRYRRSEDYADDYVNLDIRSPLDRRPYVRHYEDDRPIYYYD